MGSQKRRIPCGANFLQRLSLEPYSLRSRSYSPQDTYNDRSINH